MKQHKRGSRLSLLKTFPTGEKRNIHCCTRIQVVLQSDSVRVKKLSLPYKEQDIKKN